MNMRIELLMLGLAALILLPCAGCSDEDPASPGDAATPADTVAPAAVADLRVESIAGSVVTLAWTAPGDDGDTGTASQYDVRYSTDPIAEGNWAAGTQIATEPAPAVAGTEQGVVIDTGGGADIHFALKAADEVPNWSGLSNVAIAPLGGSFVVHQLTSEGNNIQPCLSEGHVVWVRANFVEGDEIYIANLESAYPMPTSLTDNGGEKEHPNNHGSERIVWEGREGPSGDWEIWLYDHYSIPRYDALTDNEVPDRYPDLAGAGDFAWLQGYPMYESVRYWNESGHSDSMISGGCCSTTIWSNDAPSADDGSVVWRSYDRVGDEGHAAHLWNGVTTDLTDTIEAGMATAYSLFEGDIAYEYGADPSLIRYWDGSTIHTVGEGYEPSLYAGTIAYEVWDGHDWEIRYWDGTTIHEITDNDYNDTQVSLHGSLIAWVGRPGALDQIFYVSVAK